MLIVVWNVNIARRLIRVIRELQSLNLRSFIKLRNLRSTRDMKSWTTQWSCELLTFTCTSNTCYSSIESQITRELSGYWLWNITDGNAEIKINFSNPLNMNKYFTIDCEKQFPIFSNYSTDNEGLMDYFGICGLLWTFENVLNIKLLTTLQIALRALSTYFM